MAVGGYLKSRSLRHTHTHTCKDSVCLNPSEVVRGLMQIQLKDVKDTVGVFYVPKSVSLVEFARCLLLKESAQTPSMFGGWGVGRGGRNK